MQSHFGSWNKAIEKAGLKILRKRVFSDKELFENIEEVWIKLGRQPGKRDMKQPLSKCSSQPYVTKFGTLTKALEAFVAFINSDNGDDPEAEEIIVEALKTDEPVFKHKTKRQPSERLKVQVLMRDGNTCRLCGITVTGENIHFDHILAWSKGGETILENLQVLCSPHNLAKGNVEYESVE